MTVSLRVMSVGDGYKYLLKSVAAGDGNRAMATPLTMYYAETGCPPGRWIGSGLEALGSEAVQPGNVVTEAQLERLIGAGIHPHHRRRAGCRLHRPRCPSRKFGGSDWVGAFGRIRNHRCQH